jgi:hypothetical protein
MRKGLGPEEEGSTTEAEAPEAITAADAAAEEVPVWDQLTSDTEDPSAHHNTTTGAGRKAGVSSRIARSPGLPADQRRRIGIIVGAVTLVFLLGVAVFLWLAHTTPDPKPDFPVARPPLLVDPSGANNAYTRLQDAIAQARTGDRILVQEDIEEAGIILRESVKDLTIEAAPGKSITWKAPSKGPAQEKLITIGQVEGFHLRGFTLDGNNQVKHLIHLWGRCPGVKVENIVLKNWKENGIYVTNCLGGASPNRIVFSGLDFTIGPSQPGVCFTILPGIKQIQQNRFITFRDCRFQGAGSKFKAPKAEFIDDVILPEGAHLDVIP